jgi:integrase
MGIAGRDASGRRQVAGHWLRSLPGQWAHRSPRLTASPQSRISTALKRAAEADELVDEVVLYLAWEVQQGVEKLAFGPAWHVDGGLGLERAIVTEADGTVVHPDTLLGRWKRLVKVAGVPVIPLHGARHSYAELALSSGVRLDVVSRTLGHSSSGFTADQYSHDNDEAATEAAEIVGRALR